MEKHDLELLKVFTDKADAILETNKKTFEMIAQLSARLTEVEKQIEQIATALKLKRLN